MWFQHGLDNPQSDYADVQQFAVHMTQPGDILVEVGSFVGESTAYLIDLVRASGKDLRLYSVDLWDIEEMCRDGGHTLDARMNDNGLTPRAWMEAMGPRCMLAEFYRNLAHKDRVRLLTGALVGRSNQMATIFKDKSISFCYIDAGHSYENVLADMAAWWPKMKPNGTMAGHDWFSGAEVRRAVTDFANIAGLHIGLTQSSWVMMMEPGAQPTAAPAPTAQAAPPPDVPAPPPTQVSDDKPTEPAPIVDPAISDPAPLAPVTESSATGQPKKRRSRRKV